jgi:hypothetical protein
MRAPWTIWSRRDPIEEAAAVDARLEGIRQEMLAALADCGSGAAERIRLKARSMRSGADLWLLRGEIYQLVACRHCEAEARRRVNSLLPAFKGWVPAAALTRI